MSSRESRRHRSRSPRRRRSRSPRHQNSKSDSKSDVKIQEAFSSSPNKDDASVLPKEGPNMELSGKLLEDTNVFNGVVIKYSEPPEARKPRRRWRFYVFKGSETLPVLHLHRQSAYLIGKDRKIADMPVDHPSCSRQHAVLQYRVTEGKTRPYIIDLESSNGTFLNNKRIDARRYYELKEKDVLKFGFSSREYVLLHEDSHENDNDDDENIV